MDKGKIQKIYSRRIPRIKYFKSNNEDNNDKQKIKKILKIIIVLTIAFMIVNSVINIIEPIIDLQSVIMAKSVATRITNEQSKKVMEKYQYEDLVNITKDSNGNITMISANVTTVNKMIADISTKIQKEQEKRKRLPPLGCCVSRRGQAAFMHIYLSDCQFFLTACMIAFAI